MSVLFESELPSQSLRDNSYKSVNGSGLISLSKYGKDLYQFNIARKLSVKGKEVLYEICIIVEYSRTLVGIKNMFKKNKIKSNKDDTMISFFNTIKQLVEECYYDPFSFKDLMNTIRKGGGSISHSSLIRTNLSKLIFGYKSENLKFKDMIEFLKDNKIF